MSWLRRKLGSVGVVVYYHHQLPADYFTGWAGLVILLLNWIRHKVARAVEYRVMLFLLNRVGLDDEIVEAYKQRWADEGSEARGRRPFATLGTLFSADDEDPRFRYVEGRKNTPTQEERAAEELKKRAGGWAQYMTKGATKTYAAGRADSLVQEVEAERVPREKP